MSNWHTPQNNFTFGQNLNTGNSNFTNKISNEITINEINKKLNSLNEINEKLNSIKSEINIMKYKESTRHIVHQGIICENCRKQNIHGIRYKCFHCPNYNICEECERYLSYIHDASHFFIRIHDTVLYNNLTSKQNYEK